MNIFTTILIQPILNLIIWLYNVIPGHDIGVAIILLTIIVKGLLHPLFKQQIKQQRALQLLQPKMDEIRKRLKDDKEAQSRELMALYATEKVNPLASCLPLLIQLPIFIALYSVLRKVVGTFDPSLLYPFVAAPGSINPVFLGFLDLTKPNIYLAIAAGAVQFVQSKQMMSHGVTKPPPKDVADAPGAKDESMAAMMNKQMMYMLPVMTIVIGFGLPGALMLYWFTMSILTVIQQWHMFREKKPVAVGAGQDVATS
jgi:YidC/Oxa1 family membrane protein insertase